MKTPTWTAINASDRLRTDFLQLPHGCLIRTERIGVSEALCFVPGIRARVSDDAVTFEPLPATSHVSDPAGQPPAATQASIPRSCHACTHANHSDGKYVHCAIPPSANPKVSRITSPTGWTPVDAANICPHFSHS